MEISHTAKEPQTLPFPFLKTPHPPYNPVRQ